MKRENSKEGGVARRVFKIWEGSPRHNHHVWQAAGLPDVSESWALPWCRPSPRMNRIGLEGCREKGSQSAEWFGTTDVWRMELTGGGFAANRAPSGRMRAGRDKTSGRVWSLVSGLLNYLRFSRLTLCGAYRRLTGRERFTRGTCPSKQK